MRFSPESGDKETRAEGFSAQAEAGNVFLVEGDWNEAYLQELELFPFGDWDDQVDASSRAFHHLAPMEFGTEATDLAGPASVANTRSMTP